MGLITIDNFSDSTVHTAAQHNNPLNTIVNEINGNIDTANLKDDSVTPAKILAGTGASWAWQSYTATLTASTTNPTLGTGGSANAWFTQIGKTVFFQGLILFGTSGAAAGSGIYSIALPVTAHSNVTSSTPLGAAYARDNSTNADLGGQAIMATNTTINIRLVASTTDQNVATGANPWTWAENDQIRFSGFYEVA